MRKTYTLWALESICYLAIAIILQTQVRYYFLIVPIIGIAFLKRCEYINIEKDKKNSLHAQLNLIVHYLYAQGFESIRCTFHIIKGTKFYQVLNYIPSGTGSDRTFPLDKGIIGKSFRNKESFVENFIDDCDYRDRMIKDYGYTEIEIKKRTMDRRSYFCYPLLDENHNILGVIYFDSSINNTFPSIDDRRIKDLITFLEKIKDSMI